ncbi:MAG TPA: hypothetical protein VL400_00520 [Polyangiaceae bacterium]|nr:hypothetical protein [Polyangiaceae bacterium]
MTPTSAAEPGRLDTASTSATSAAAPAPSASAARAAETDAHRFADLVDGLSEPDTYFFSDNLVTNETSYLQIADDLPSKVDASGVYVGVGPEQNFSYIALTRPSAAYVVDIRRGNMLLHLLYRAAFEESASRAHFVALLLGRAHDPSKTTSPTATIDEVLKSATAGDASEATYEAAHEKLAARIRSYGVKLADDDWKGIEKMHHVYFEKGLGLRFELKEKNGRTYPTLSEILATKSPSGNVGGFLASEDSFRFLQSMERSGRIVPIVGDFAGDKALPQLASYLKSEGRTVSVFYVSNVEQYLLEPPVWAKWVRNVRALPKNDKSLFIRAYLDQGKKHPREMKGHRTATVMSRMIDFETIFGDKKTTTLFALSTEKIL